MWWRMVPLALPATPHSANSRMHIAPTESASVPTDNTYIQSIPAMGTSLRRVTIAHLIWIKGSFRLHSFFDSRASAESESFGYKTSPTRHADVIDFSNFDSQSAGLIAIFWSLQWWWSCIMGNWTPSIVPTRRTLRY